MMMGRQKVPRATSKHLMYGGTLGDIDTESQFVCQLIWHLFEERTRAAEGICRLLEVPKQSRVLTITPLAALLSRIVRFKQAIHTLSLDDNCLKNHSSERSAREQSHFTPSIWRLFQKEMQSLQTRGFSSDKTEACYVSFYQKLYANLTSSGDVFNRSPGNNSASLLTDRTSHTFKHATLTRLQQHNVHANHMDESTRNPLILVCVSLRTPRN